MKLIEYTAWIVIFIITLLLDSTIVHVMPSINFLNTFFILLGKEILTIIIAAAISISFIYYKKKDAIKLWLGLIITVAVSYIIQILIQRPRPFIVYSFKPLIEPILTYSFPSMTTAAIFAMLPFMTRNYHKQRILWWTIAVTIGFSRLYVGVHFISDVVFGAFVGYFISDTFFENSKKRA